MIALDIESSGLDSGSCGIWQIGALELENPQNSFFEEARIDKEDIIIEEALELTGKTEADLRDSGKQSQKQLILNFLEWAKTCKTRIMVGQNIGWDISFIQNKCIKYNILDKLRDAINFRALDIHTLAQLRYKEKHGEFLLKEDGRSDMNLSNAIKFCGLEDTRAVMEDGKIVKEGTPHNALEDAKLTAECFRRLTK